MKHFFSSCRTFTARAGLAAIFLSAASLVSAEPVLVKAKSINGQTIDALPGQVIVKYRKGRSAHAKARFQKVFTAKSLRSLGPLEAEVLKVPAGETIDSFINTLKSDPDVEFAEPNGLMRANYSVNDSSAPSQYYLGPNYLNMLNAWDITRGSATVTIAVLDTGSLFSHSEFTGQYVAGNGTTIGIDWNGNGDFTEDFGCGSGLGEEQVQDDPPLDNNFDDCSGTVSTTGIFHGTRVSSIIGAVTNNNAGMAGIAHNCQLMAVKVLNNKGVGPFDTVANGIVWATTSGAKVINMSLGSSASSSLMTAAVQYALSNDVVVVAASGNAGPNCSVEFPASISGIIAVGATRDTDTLASFSCTGSNLDLVAPGVDVLALTSNSDRSQTRYVNSSGTSFSSPMVAAVAGLVRSIAPTLNYTQITQYLNNFADDLGSPGFDTSYGFGRLDANATLVAVSSQTAVTSDNSSPGKTYPAPNPFRPSQGNVKFYLPSALGTQGLEINLYNIAGEKIKTLDGGCLNALGQCEWNGRNEDGNVIASGFYLYRVKTSGGELTGKLTVVK